MLAFIFVRCLATLRKFSPEAQADRGKSTSGNSFQSLTHRFDFLSFAGYGPKRLGQWKVNVLFANFSQVNGSTEAIDEPTDRFLDHRLRRACTRSDQYRLARMKVIDQKVLGAVYQKGVPFSSASSFKRCELLLFWLPKTITTSASGSSSRTAS
jgi:hypothetical protein